MLHIFWHYRLFRFTYVNFVIFCIYYHFHKTILFIRNIISQAAVFNTPYPHLQLLAYRLYSCSAYGHTECIPYRQNGTAVLRNCFRNTTAPFRNLIQIQPHPRFLPLFPPQD